MIEIVSVRVTRAEGVKTMLMVQNPPLGEMVPRQLLVTVKSLPVVVMSVMERGSVPTLVRVTISTELAV